MEKLTCADRAQFLEQFGSEIPLLDNDEKTDASLAAYKSILAAIEALAEKHELDAGKKEEYAAILNRVFLERKPIIF